MDEQIRPGEPLPPAEVEGIAADFARDGYRLIPGILNADEVGALREAVDRVFAEPRWAASSNLYGDFIAVRLFETDPVFEAMLTREPIIGLAERLLGADCHLMAENVVRNAPGQAIDTYHVDDRLYFPVAEGMERHDPRLAMPLFVMTFQIPLTDIETLAHGPTQFVPGSHNSGRQPNDRANPSFEGREPVSILCRAGDLYLHNGQCWHRGAPNTSDRRRYLLQLAFSQRWVSQRFYPFVNYRLPEGLLERSDDRRRRVLGIHPPGAYG